MAAQSLGAAITNMTHDLVLFGAEPVVAAVLIEITVKNIRHLGPVSPGNGR